MSEQAPESVTPCLFPQSVMLWGNTILRQPYTDAIALQWALVETGRMKQEEAERIASRPTSARVEIFKYELQDAYSKNIPVSPLLFNIITNPSIFGDFNTPRSLSLLIYDTLFGENNTKPNARSMRHCIVNNCKREQSEIAKKPKRKRR